MPQTKKPRLTAIVAMSSNRVIGRDGKLPWHLPEDLKFFKQTTLGHPILMGRKTFESIGRPLPKRRNIVLSRTMAAVDGVEVIRDLSQLQELVPSDETVFVIGGAEVFKLLMSEFSSLYLTHIHQPYEGDAIMPEFESQFTTPKIIQSLPEMEFRYYERQP
jgi:dihydrofolate reductase